MRVGVQAVGSSGRECPDIAFLKEFAVAGSSLTLSAQAPAAGGFSIVVCYDCFSCNFCGCGRGAGAGSVHWVR